MDDMIKKSVTDFAVEKVKEQAEQHGLGSLVGQATTMLGLGAQHPGAEPSSETSQNSEASESDVDLRAGQVSRAEPSEPAYQKQDPTSEDSSGEDNSDTDEQN